MDITYLNNKIPVEKPSDHSSVNIENDLIKRDIYVRKVRLAILGSVYLVLIIFSLVFV